MKQLRSPIVQCWSVYPMSSTLVYPSIMSTINKTSSHEGYSSADSESRKQQQTPQGTKRRPSRAGTRSVTTLTAAQLERKRANDREAQRAIRQRTKDHIESLERRISELASHDNNARMLETLQRNEELEQENAVLRNRLHHLSGLGTLDNPGIQGTDASMLPGPPAAPPPPERMGVMQPPRPSSTSTARSIPSAASSAVSQPEWSQHHYSPAPATSPMEASSQTVHHQDPSSATDMRWSPHANAAVSQALPPVPESAFHNVEQPQMGYYGSDHAPRSVPYTGDGAQHQQTLPYGNAPPHQHPQAPTQGNPQTYGYAPHQQTQQHPVTDYSQHRTLPGQPGSYQHYGHQQPYMNQAPPQGGAGHVQHGGDGLPLMPPQGTPQGQGGHMLYNMKVEQ